LKSYQGSGNDHAYAYDADDERALSFNVATGESVFRLRGLGGMVLREFRLAGGVWSWHRDYIHRGGQLLAQVQPGADGLRFAHLDHLGTPRLYTDAGGIARESRKHYPYGEILAATTPGSSDFVMAFTGHERDDNGVGTTDDLDYMHARYYSPSNGRFLTTDPARRSFEPKTPQSWNRYSYARNNPLLLVDPDGEAAALALPLAPALAPLFTNPVTAVGGIGIAAGTATGLAIGEISIGNGRTVNDAISDSLASAILIFQGGQVSAATTLESSTVDGRGGRGRFKTTQDALDQLESIEHAQDRVRSGRASGVIIDSAEKSKQRVENALAGLKTLADAVEEWLLGAEENRDAEDEQLEP
jgi:RHS repeat-associated protein